jgi:hypothetical protein
MNTVENKDTLKLISMLSIFFGETLLEFEGTSVSWCDIEVNTETKILSFNEYTEDFAIKLYGIAAINGYTANMRKDVDEN